MAKPFGSVCRFPFVGVRLALFAQIIERNSSHWKEGRKDGGGGHTHMEVRQKGIDINRKNYIWCYCHNRVFPSAQVSSVTWACVCMCVCAYMCRVCSCVFESTSSVEQTYVFFVFFNPQTYLDHLNLHNSISTSPRVLPLPAPNQKVNVTVRRHCSGLYISTGNICLQ